MTTLFNEEFDKICRCCLCKNGEMRPLFGSCLDNMLKIVAEIDVKAGDGLPELMCVPCVLQVSRAFTFKQLCQRSDQSLRALVGKVREFNVSDSKNYKNLATNNDEQPLNEQMVIETGTENKTIGHQLTLTDDANNLDSGLALGSLEEEIELSSLPSESQFSSVAAEEIQHLTDDVLSDAQNMKEGTNLSTKFGDYFDEIKLDVVQVVSLTDGHLSDQSIEEQFDDIPTDEKDDKSKKMASDEFIEDILSAEKKKTEIESKFNCIDCNLNFETNGILNAHVQTLHLSDRVNSSTTSDANKMESKNAFECPECHKLFAEKKILKRHSKIHSPIKPHKCSECNMCFAESSNLSKHKKKHTGELRAVVGKPNLCSVCGKGFKWGSSLSKHMKHHTRHKILNCPYCPKYYVEARSLNIHMRTHTGEKPFQCEVCKKGFTQMGNLEKHIRVHTGEKPFTCPICSKGFSQSGYVAIHLRTHTGEKPYLCDFVNCGRAFAGSNTLAIHKRTHTGERPFQCSMCEKSFARQETANIHQRTHTGEKPFECKICARGFTSSGHLTGHMRSHTGTKTHECKVCLKRFAGSSSLKVHMKSHAEKAAQQQQQQQEQEQQHIYDAKTTVFECNMCKMNIPSSALTSPEELHAYNHEFIDDVLICSNVASIIDSGNENEMILTTDIQNGQQLLMNLADLK